MTDREVVRGSAPRRARMREFVANRSYPQRLGALGVVLVLLTAPFGGLKSAAGEKTQPLVLDQRIDIGPFYVTLESVTQLSDLEPAVSPEVEDAKLLVLKLQVTNHTDRAETSVLVRDAVGGEHTGFVPWSTDRGQILPHVFDVDDATTFNEYVNPGQSYTLALVLQQKPNTDLEKITFKIYGYRFREVDPQTLSPNTWVFDDIPLVEGHVPIVVKP